MKSLVETSVVETRDEEAITLSSFRAITHCNDRLIKLGNEISSEFGLHLSEMAVLDTLGWMGSLTMGELSREALISPSNTTHVVKKLVSMGLASRQRSAESERVVTGCLTKKGEALHAKTKNRMICEVEDYFSEKLNSSERRTLNRLMVKLCS